MKKLIALTAILASTSVLATENLEFGDLNYFLKQSQFNLAANATLSTVQYKSGTPGSKEQIETEGYTLQTAYGFGILDNLNVYLGLDYDFKMQVANETTNDKKYNQDGLKDPSLAVNYRLMNQKEAYVNFDIGALVRYSMTDREVGTSSGNNAKDGNAASGQSSYELNASVGRKWNEANEWRLSAGFVHHTDGDYDQLSTSGGKTNVDIDSSQDIYVRAAYQYRPVQEFMMTVSLTGTRVGEHDEKTGGTTSTYEDHMSYDFLFNAKYLVTDTFIVKFSLNEGLNPDYDVKTSGSKTEVSNIRAAYWGLGVDLLF